jgi:eukaryotic-like serine/threonine-protein kinase
MEHVPGGNLKDRVRDGGPLDADAAAGMVLQVADALGFAHERGVIHRDVKPHNILLTEAGYVKVADFGIARAANATTTTSRSGPVMGTAGYISPEQAMGGIAGPQSDLYSLGVVLFEALTGELPYKAEDPVALAMKHVNEPPRSPREANPEVPEPLEALILKLLAKHPEDRYPSASALAKDLERVRSEIPPPTAAPKKAARKTAAPLFPAPEAQTRIMSGQSLLTTEPAKGPEGGMSGRIGLLTILAALLFGSVLLGVLVWALLRGSGIS